jgi:hypothetical protein
VHREAQRGLEQLYQMQVELEKKTPYVEQVTGVVVAVAVRGQQVQLQFLRAVMAEQAEQLQFPEQAQRMAVAVAVVPVVTQVVLRPQVELEVQVEAATEQPPHGMPQLQLAHRLQDRVEWQILVVVVAAVVTAITTSPEMLKVAVEMAEQELSWCAMCFRAPPLQILMQLMT